MKVAIIGFGVEGKAALAYWAARSADITVCDQNIDADVPAGVAKQLGPRYLDELENFDVIFRSAGINRNTILAEHPRVADKITTTINEFLRVCPTRNTIGVTGTKGKGTTSTLIAKMLEAAGKQVFLGGNIGVSPFNFLPELTEDSWVVLELSSFQLSDLEYSPHIGVCLMIAPEHLNWHHDMADYIAAKSHVFAKQMPDDIAIYYANNKYSKQLASAGQGQKIPYYAPPGAKVSEKHIVIGRTPVCRLDDLKLLGKHNWQNVCAAVTAVWQVTQDLAAIRSVLTSFSGLEHRLEFVRELDGVKYYDDSFGTTPETAMVAIESFREPKVVILGGSDKGAKYTELATTVATSNVRQVILIGATAPKIQAALESSGFTAITPGGDTMTDIVAAARKAAQPGDVVLLSTASASLDMFQNYKTRGNQFKQAVNDLA